MLKKNMNELERFNSDLNKSLQGVKLCEYDPTTKIVWTKHFETIRFYLKGEEVFDVVNKKKVSKMCDPEYYLKLKKEKFKKKHTEDVDFNMSNDDDDIIYF